MDSVGDRLSLCRVRTGRFRYGCGRREVQCCLEEIGTIKPVPLVLSDEGLTDLFFSSGELALHTLGGGVQRLFPVLLPRDPHVDRTEMGELLKTLWC